MQIHVPFLQIYSFYLSHCLEILALNIFTSPKTLQTSNSGLYVRLLPRTSTPGDCSNEASLERLLVHRMSKIMDEDVIIMADMNVIPLKRYILLISLYLCKKNTYLFRILRIFWSDSLDPLQLAYHTWIFGYDQTILKTGKAFPVSLLAMESKSWNVVLGNMTSSELLWALNLFENDFDLFITRCVWKKQIDMVRSWLHVSTTRGQWIVGAVVEQIPKAKVILKKLAEIIYTSKIPASDRLNEEMCLF